MGDSRTILQNNTWPVTLAAQGFFDITSATDPLNLSKVANWSSDIAARIAQVPADEPPAYVLINIGVHDMMFGLPDGATWRAGYTSALDAIHAAFPDARILVMKPWQRDDDADADTVAGWLDTVVASRSTFTFHGPDERVWMKGADNGATMGELHYTAAGQIECKDQWLSILAAQ